MFSHTATRFFQTLISVTLLILSGPFNPISILSMLLNFCSTHVGLSSVEDSVLEARPQCISTNLRGQLLHLFMVDASHSRLSLLTKSLSRFSCCLPIVPPSFPVTNYLLAIFSFFPFLGKIDTISFSPFSTNVETMKCCFCESLNFTYLNFGVTFTLLLRG